MGKIAAAVTTSGDSWAFYVNDGSFHATSEITALEHSHYKDAALMLNCEYYSRYTATGKLFRTGVYNYLKS